MKMYRVVEIEIWYGWSGREISHDETIIFESPSYYDCKDYAETLETIYDTEHYWDEDPDEYLREYEVRH